MRTAVRYVWLVLFCLTSSAQQISPNLFNGLAWRLIGPFRGGRSVAVSGVPGGGSTFYFGAVDGGIWKTDDAGNTWTPIFDGQPVASIGALAVAPSDPKILYAGTGESDIRSDLASGDGVYKSIDGGKTWTNIGLRETRQISRIVVDPTDPNVVYVAAQGNAYVPNEERGVFATRDGGQTWKKVLDRGPAAGAADIAIAMDAPSVLFAAMWEAHRPPWSTYAPIAGPGSGLFRSTDGGNSWQQLRANGLPEGEWGRVGIAVTRGTGGKRIYASIDARNSGMYRSDDGGDTWALVNSDARVTTRAWYFSSITADPNNPDVVYVPNVALYKLSDGGKILNIVRGAPGGDDYHQLWIDPANSSHMVLGTDQGTSVTLNGGSTWSSWYNQPTAQFYHVIVDNQYPYHVYGAQQDSGTAAVASSTDHVQIDSRDWFTVSGSESGYIVPDPNDRNVFYVSGTYGSLFRFDRRTSQSQNIAPSPLQGFETPLAQRKYRDPWTPVLALSPVAPHALYLGTQYVMKTLDGGLHWQTISPDLTGAKTASVEMDSTITPEKAKEIGYGVVYSIAPSPLNASEIWVGSDTGLVHLTRDGGKMWTEVTPKGLGAWSKITQIEVSRFVPGEAYIAVDRHRLDDRKPYIFRTRNFGKTWEPIAEGIPEPAFLNSLREDPKRRGLLYAATEFGVYVSFNDGEQWQSLQLNLPVTSVRDLVVHENDLVIATHGRAFWVLDDIAPLRQAASKVADAEAWLYRPSAAVRTVSDLFPGTPVPPEEPQAKNAPRGAHLDYYLRNASAEVILEILDPQGRSVRRFSSREKSPEPPKDAAIAGRWFPKPQRLSEEPGMHRFIWDLRYGRFGQATLGDPEDTGIKTSIGPLAVPGLYMVKLTVNGQSMTQPLEVILDPRSAGTKLVLEQQFQWAQRAFEDLITTTKTIEELTALQAKLTKSKPRSNPSQTRLLSAIGEVDRNAGAILTGDKNNPEKGLQYVQNALETSLTSMESADRIPPAQVIDLYRSSATTLRARLADWNKLRQNLLPKLNQQLREAGFSPIEDAKMQ